MFLLMSSLVDIMTKFFMGEIFDREVVKFHRSNNVASLLCFFFLY